jgi:hypothetical protein
MEPAAINAVICVHDAANNVIETHEEAKTAASANLVPAVTARTMKIDNRLAQIKSTAVKFQAAVEQKQQQLADLSHTVLRTINLLVVSLTALLVVVAAGQMLLIYVCWEYVRSGRFPLLRVMRTNLAAPYRRIHCAWTSQCFMRRVCAPCGVQYPCGSLARL